MKTLYSLLVLLLLSSNILAVDRLQIDVDNNDAVDVTYGGTNAKTAAAARTNLGAAAEDHTHAGSFQSADSDLNSLASGITGIVLGAGNGGGYAAAVAGTDYVAPDADLTSIAGGITGLVLGGGNGNGYSAAVAGTDYLAPAAIGVTVQAYDADLDTASTAGAAAVSTYFGKNAAGTVGFHSLPAAGSVPDGGSAGDLLQWDGDEWVAISSLSNITLGGFSTTAGTAVVSDGSGYLSQSFTNFLPDAADGAALGSADAEWSDLYIATGGVIYGQNDQSNTITSGTEGWTFNKNVILPDAGGVRIVSSASDAKYSGILINLTAGETLAFGNLVYFKSDGKAWKADSDGIATMPCIGVVVVGASADATATVMTHGVITETDWNFGTVGGMLYVSETSGSVEDTLANISDANDVVQVIGIALSADTMLFNPSLSMVILD